MLRYLLAGAAAGAAGTAALNIATYFDMTLRGRPASQVPAKMAADLMQKAGISTEGQTDGAAERSQNRTNGLGALMGYAVGLGLGALFGTLRPQMRRLPLPLVAGGLAVAAMALGDGPAVALGATDLREWTAASWISNIVPHVLYGLVTAAVCDALFGGRSESLGEIRRRGRRQTGRTRFSAGQAISRAQRLVA